MRVPLTEQHRPLCSRKSATRFLNHMHRYTATLNQSISLRSIPELYGITARIIKDAKPNRRPNLVPSPTTVRSANTATQCSIQSSSHATNRVLSIVESCERDVRADARVKICKAS